MAFSLGPGAAQDEDAVLAAINTTPLVDVMLVLLIIFLITIPVVIHTVPLQLPKEASQPTPAQPQTIHLSVDRNGTIYWEQAVVSMARLRARLAESAHKEPLPVVQIRGDSRTRYEAIGRVMLACQQAGIGRVGFVTEPPAAH
ncbi:MAG: biopolymer transporter ExbD [Betaproteobacteria bacterium]|nr:biopolymer transporter ExbD [Betaproteobacteria bacterium]MDE2353998.1 biopolymer transporter ExbD [Betaproteobacteria bacterium]